MFHNFNQSYKRLTFVLLTCCFFSSGIYAFQTPAQLTTPLHSIKQLASPPDCMTSPVIVCPSLYYGCPGDSTMPSNTGAATATPGDVNCPQPIITYTDSIHSTGPCAGATEIHRMWRANYPDPTNPWLYAECTQIIVLSDDEVPTISNCPDNMIVSPDSNCEAIVNWTPPTATDNCGLDSFNSTHMSGDTFQMGITSVVYSATDECGNITNCTFEVNVSGSCCFHPPILTCPANYTGCPNDNTTPTNTGQATAVMGSPLCDMPTVTFSDNVISTGPCNGATVIERTWSAMYANDTTLVSSCIQTITLEDVKSPLISGCPTNMTLAPGANCTAVANWTEPIAADNCGLSSFVSTHDSGDAFVEGLTMVTYTATDNCGNVKTCAFSVTVTTCCTNPPVITCPSSFEGCPSSSSEPSITGQATAVAGGASCGAPNITHSDEVVSTGPCIGETVIKRTWIATDANDSNLTASCIQIINLIDVLEPVIIDCPTDITVETPNVSIPVSWTAPSSTDNCEMQSFTSNQMPGDDFIIGTTNVTYTAMDNCGNDSNCTFAVTVIQICGAAPIITCPANYEACPSTSLDPVSTGIATATGATPACATPIVTYSDDTLTNGPCQGAIKLKRTWTATDPDDSTLSSSCIQIIELLDDELPVISGCPVDITIESATIPAAASWTEPTAVDNCFLEWIMGDYAPGDLFPEGNTLVTYTAADNCENASFCTFTVTVIKICNVSPVITCPADYEGCPSTTIDPATTGMASAVPGSADCNAPVITFNDEVISAGPCAGQTKIKRTWTATDPDDSALSSSCIQIVDLIDDKAPLIFNCPGDITVTTTGSNGIAMWTEPTAADNCDLEWIMGDYAPGDVFPVGVTTVTYTAADACDNASQCTFTVTISQVCGSNPIITCPSNYEGCPESSLDPATTGSASAQAGSPSCPTPVISYSDEVITTGPCAGATKVKRTWTATDPVNSTLTSSCIQIIDLIDNKIPLIFDCPSDITVSANGNTGVASWIEPTATDNCELEWIMGDYAPGDSFPIGSTLVTYTAFDGCGNTSICTFTVTVETETTLTCPPDITTNCSGPNGAIVTFNPPVLETTCPPCNGGQPIPGFIYMGQMNGSAYYCSVGQADAATAAYVAASHGGYLAVITSQAENDYLSGFLGNQCAYIGLSDELNEGSFVWSNGEPYNYNDWAPGQPNNYNGNQDCVVMNCGGGWNDEYCTAVHEYIMEVPICNNSIIQILGPPSGSVFPLGTTLVKFGGQDGCGNYVECSFNVTVEATANLICPSNQTYTCPVGGSGVIASWGAPTLQTCCASCSGGNIPGFLYMGNYNGSHYYCSVNPTTWPQADAIATSYGAHLAEVNSAGENSFLANILSLQRAWIGLNDVNNEGNFSWSNGNPLTYTNWYPGQPNNDLDNQDYVAMLNNGQWNDEYNNLGLEFIMEVSCSSITQIAGPPSGSFIPIGTTTITYVGSDNCGNTDTCSFDIVVNGNTNCDSYGQDSWYMWIENLGFGSYNNTSGNNGGYKDFSNGQCIDVQINQAYPLTFTPGFAGTVYNMYWKMWIDYNQDGDYFDSGEFVAYGNGYNQLTGNLIIPSYCVTGQTTMRLSMKYGGFPSSPCEVFSNGEVEDYCLNVSNSIIKDGNEGSRSIGQAIELQSLNSTLGLDIAESLQVDEKENEIKILSESSLSLFPNPTRNELYLELSGVNELVDFSIYNADGQILSSKKLDLSSGKQVLDVSNLTTGIYYLKSTDGRFGQKFVISR